MNAAWKLVSTRGCLAASVMTIKRARAEGFLGEENYEDAVIVRGTRCRFLMAQQPDGEEERLLVWFTDADAVRSWILNMLPHSLQILVADGEDQAAIAAALRGEVH